MSGDGILIWGEFPPETQTGISILNDKIYKILKEENIPVFIVVESAWNKNSVGKIIFYMKNYLRLINTIRKKIRIVYFVFPLSVGGLIKRLLIWPIVKIFFPHTMLIGHLHRGDFITFVNKNILNRLLVKCNFCFIDKIIVLSTLFQSGVSGFAKSQEVMVLQNTSPIESLAVKRSYTYTKNFICVSNYIKTKGIKELVVCFSQKEFMSFRLTLYGESYEKSFFDKIKNLATENITINGPVSRNELPGVLQSFDCLIVPSWNEGQPLIILEAMSIGLPVISTAVGDIPNMLGNNYPFLAEPKNVSSLKNAILTFDKFKGKDKLSSMLYNRYLSNYSNKEFKKQVLKIFVNSQK